MAKHKLQINLSGSNPKSPRGANWKNAQCYPSYQPSQYTGRLVWRDPASYYYPPEVPQKKGVRGPYGTAVLIGNNLACSAGHCFDVHSPKEGGPITPYKPNTANQLAPQELTLLMSVQFDYELECEEDDEDRIADARAKQSIQSFDATQLVEYRNNDLDYAIFKLSGNPGSIYGFAKIATINPKRINFTVAIPQHPAGLPKKVARGGRAICKDEFCRELKYYLDTLGGSSGSGIFYKGFLVGIHTYGVEKKKENGAVSMIAIFRASQVIQDIVLKDAGLYDRYHDTSEFVKGFLLGAFASGGGSALYCAYQEKFSTSKKATITSVCALFGGVVGGGIMDQIQKARVKKELSEKWQYSGLSLTS